MEYVNYKPLTTIVLEQAEMPSSVMEKLNLRTGGSAVQSGVPLHFSLECFELRDSSVSLYPLK